MFGLIPHSLAAGIWPALNLFGGAIGAGLRYALAKRLAGEVGEVVYFGPGIQINHWHKISIGSNVSIHQNCYIDAVGGLVIGNDVSIAHDCSIITFNHTWGDESVPIRSNPLELKAITIGNDVWVGCGCRLLAGITVGGRAVIAAGSVVVKDVSPRVVAGGVPARNLKEI